MYTALTSASTTIAAYLRHRLETDPSLSIFFSGGTMTVSLNNPQEMNDANREGLSLWLYRIVRDDQRLNVPPRRLDPVQHRRPPLPLRLHYLVTPLVGAATPDSPELEQRVLGKVLQSLHDHPIFRGTDLEDDLRGTDVEFHARIEPMTLEEITRVWNALDQSYQLSVSYEVSVLEIESEIVDAVSPVAVVESQYGVMSES